MAFDLLGQREIAPNVLRQVFLPIWSVFFRIGLFHLAIYVGAHSSSYALSFMEGLGYQKPLGFFGFTLEDIFTSWILASIFWIGIVFGALGKKIDYLIIGVSGVLALVSFYGLSAQIFGGLIAASLLGNVIGYLLKLGRERFSRG